MRFRCSNYQVIELINCCVMHLNANYSWLSRLVCFHEFFISVVNFCVKIHALWLHEAHHALHLLNNRFNLILSNQIVDNLKLLLEHEIL